MDGILTYMYMMLNKANLTGQPIRRSDFVALGKNVKLYPGVEKWFRRINEYGRQHNIEIEHFIISSGLTEIIEGTTIAGEFKKIYACKYCYNASGVAGLAGNRRELHNKNAVYFPYQQRRFG